MINELFTSELYVPNLTATSKKEAIEEMAAKLEEKGYLISSNQYLDAVFKREEEYSTGIGMGVAIPHGKSSGVAKPALVFARSAQGVEFDSMDGEKAHLLFMVAVPENSADTHLKVLGTLSRKLMHKDIRDSLMNAQSYEDIIKILE